MVDAGTDNLEPSLAGSGTAPAPDRAEVPRSGMAEFVCYTLDDGSEVLFETAESELVGLQGMTGTPKQGGPLADRLHGIATAAAQVADSLREKLEPHELSLELGVKVGGEVGAWFFARNSAEATITVTLTWKKPVPEGPEAG